GDFLNGGRGDDRILIGRADRASGGPGADGFVLGGWLSGAGGMATIDDYDPASDTLYLMCDPDSGPQITAETVGDPGAPGAVTRICLDGTPIAELLGAPAVDPSRIVLIPPDAAA
ncbi:MAG: calcium-binding protein, partial [Rhodobacteraceae bacterium]|nr:calcium-binding protein [Paracoccaceae bacterium]